MATKSLGSFYPLVEWQMCKNLVAFFKLLFESKQNIVVCGFVTVHKSAEAQGIWKVRTKRPPLIVIPSLSLCKIRGVFIIWNIIQKWLLEIPGPPLIVVPSVSLCNINIQHSSSKNAIRLPCGKISNPTSNCDPICLTLQHQHSSLAASGPSPHRQSRQNAMRLPCGKIS